MVDYPSGLCELMPLMVHAGGFEVLFHSLDVFEQHSDFVSEFDFCENVGVSVCQFRHLSSPVE